MAYKLRRGQIVRSHTGKAYVVREFLGSGGQGEVFKAHVNGVDYAVKWYYPGSATENQLELIKKLIAIGPPNDKFLWPLELLTDEKLQGFGYAMRLRDKSYKGIVDLMKRKIEPSFYTLTVSAIQMVDSFEKLHRKGLCYRDISFGNVFMNENRGDILICDNDNVTSEKRADKSILGTPRFMAPEIVRGESLPNVQSDLFSLSILLFYMFMVHHPLEGKQEASIKCFDLPAMKKLYGTHPVFIFDPLNRSNRPVRGVHDNALVFWDLYPESFKEAFTRSFTRGLSRIKGSRLTEKEWKEYLIALKNSIVKCGCGAENFYDITYIRSGKSKTCWACGKDVQIPPRIKIGKDIIILNDFTRIFGHHLDRERNIDFKHIIGQVVRNPKQRDQIGLRNYSETPWRVVLKDGRETSIPRGATVGINRVEEIHFGSGRVGFVRA